MNDRDDTFEVFDLSGAAVAGEAFSPLRFDRGEYIPFQELIQHIDQLPETPRRVYNYALQRRGYVRNDAMDVYLRAPGVSSSRLKEALKSPRHYLIAETARLEPRDTHHFELGTFIHSAILEPEKFEKVRVLPEANRSTTDGVCTLIRYFGELLEVPQDEAIEGAKMPVLRSRLGALERLAEERGYTFISAADRQIVDVLRASYATYGGGILPRLMRYAKTETSMYGVDASTGLRVKIRPDGIILAENLGANIILSVKTTLEQSVDGFMRAAARYRYELAEGMYLQVASEITGRPFSGTLMIIAQTVIPYQVAAVWLDAEDLQIGKYKYQHAMDIVKRCRDTDSWPGFDAMAEEGAHGILQMRFPEWIRQELKPQYLPE